MVRLPLGVEDVSAAGRSPTAPAGPTLSGVAIARHGPQGWFRAHLGHLDLAMALVLAACNVIGLTITGYAGYSFRSPDALAVLLNLGVALPIAGRRRWPLAMAAISVACYMTLGFANYASFVGQIATLVVLYSVGAYANRLPGLALALATCAGSVTYLFVSTRAVPESEALTVIGYLSTIVVELGVWALGRMLRARRLYLLELEDRADRLEQTAHAEMRATLAEERARVARELHDVVAHHVSVMTVQAAAARRTIGRSPERSTEAMRAVEETGRSALTEMRRIVGGLRESDDAGGSGAATEHAPQRGLDDVPVLIERAREAGLQASLTVVGHSRDLPDGVALAVYRVIQEGLTNTIKHAGPVRADVVVRYEPDAVVVRVTDDGPGTGRDDGQPRHGLLGMRERVVINGGTVQAGARTVGGFEVLARLPLEPEES